MKVINTLKNQIELKNKISLESESFDYIWFQKNMYEKQSRNSNRSSDTIASFLLKTYEILEHPEYERMISWDKSNVGFIIHDVVSFTRQILPKYFRHSNFSSFVRQLNMYDFHKVKQQNESLVFKNPLFCKGQQQNLKFIRRKAAKKIGGQRKPQNYDRVDAENQKYENLLKGFKKSFQSQINHSSFFYERSIQLMKDLNESNLKKQDCIKKLYEKEQHYDTTEETKQKIDDTEMEKKSSEMVECEQKPRKDTIIQIPKEFLTSQQPEKQRQNASRKVQQKYVTNGLNIDRVMQLKQELYKSLGIYQSWLQDYIEINKKKVKYMSSTRQQLIKCRENKNMENQENAYAINSAQNEKHESNDQGEQGQDQKDEEKPISLEEINERNQQQQQENVSSKEQKRQENQKQILIGSQLKGIIPILRVFDQPKQSEKSGEKVNGISGFQQGGFVPINESFSSRLFSTFSKARQQKVFQKSQRQERQQSEQNDQPHMESDESCEDAPQQSPNKV